MLEIQFTLKSLTLEIKNKIKLGEIFNDQRRLKQVLINLLTNALKFTPKGKVTLIADYLGNDKKLIKFEVKDTGIGMKKEIQQQLCQPYATFNQYCLNNEGIGMGLYICKKLIGKLGPEEQLFINSVENEGSQFGFVIYAINELENQNSFSNFKQFFEFSPTDTINENQKENKKKFHSCFRKKNLILHSKDNQSRASIQISHYNLIGNQLNQFQQSSYSQKKIQKFSSLKSIQLESEENKVQGLQETDNAERKLSCEFTHCTETRIDSKINKYLNRNEKLETDSLSNEIKSEENSLTSYEHSCETIQKISKPLYSYMENNNQSIIILLVDDSAFNLLILENYLSSSQENLPNFQILKAYDGQNAIEIFRKQNKIVNENNEQNEISIILMDCEMPILDGYSATKEIKQMIQTGDYKFCKIIAYTAHSGLEEEVKCLNYGFDAYLLKPSSKQDFISLILNNLSG